MSPDRASASGAERIVDDAIASALIRARLLALGEAIAWGLAAAAVSGATGALVAVAVAAWRWRSASRASVIGVLERAHADSRNLLVTADELVRETLAEIGRAHV